MTADDSARHTSSTPSAIRWRAPSAGDIRHVLRSEGFPACELADGQILDGATAWNEALVEAGSDPKALTALWFALRGRGELVADFFPELPELDHDQAVDDQDDDEGP
jgi:hypothetical protein